MYMKRILLIMTVLLLVIVLPSLSLAEKAPVIIDEANLLNNEDKGKLYANMLPICDYGTPIFWSTSMEHDTSSEELAAIFLRGKLGEEDGVLFLIDMTRRKLVIFSSKQLYRIVTTPKANAILDQTYRKATNGDYLGCAMDTFTMIYELLQNNTAETGPGSGVIGQCLRLLFGAQEEPNQNNP